MDFVFRKSEGNLMIKKCCFVISPISQEGTAIRGHADDVFEFIIQPAMKKFKEKYDIEINAVRADHIEQMGEITKQMFDEILQADLCVAILTGHNPNVFYELAVAQAAARPVIMLIEKGQSLPFDVKDLRCVQYELQPVTRLVQGVYANEVFDKVKSIHEEGWASHGLFEDYGYGRQLRFEQQLQRIIKTARVESLPAGLDKVYMLPSDPGRQVALVTGDIKDLEALKAHVVVSLESLDLQLARFNDLWLSGTLRYLDAEKTPGGDILEDSLNDHLQEEIRKLGRPRRFAPGSVVPTPTNKLQDWGFKYVFHVAALQGAIGDGYFTNDLLLDECVRNVFNQFADLAEGDSELRTILFPMLGAATTGLEYGQLAERMLQLIINGMKQCPSCQKTYLLAWIEPHLHAFRKAAKKLKLREVRAVRRQLHTLEQGEGLQNGTPLRAGVIGADRAQAPLGKKAD
jgi:O-acetyl-ADP-ribose deacetylase (regulator of RNase III)